MNPFPHTPAFLAAARRIVWFKEPAEALRHPLELMAYAMKHSTDEDMALLLGHIRTEGLREAIDHAPPGIIDPRSWSYWNAKVGRYPPPPMPRRTFDREPSIDRA
ncbi:hypothetical protein [Hyphomicrobium sp. NDB2Meth4]|uniref:hypothetical protein n=1 Tax=Hyphomicrobium sp. NDB2Meth4 TaxID=1892846 RepID=UPI0009301607|nr:hypothetical protein [Hyphomicrobium sp. NDB2Meth4]